jgi:hypothetical protein
MRWRAGLAVDCGSAVGAVFFNAGHYAGDEDEQRRPDREGVVLLIGRDGEEEQRPGGEEESSQMVRTRNLRRAT